MRVIHDIDKFYPDYDSLALSLGNFDGCHLGHDKLIQTLKQSDCQKKAIMTFDPHPVTLFSKKEEVIKFITPGEERFRMLGMSEIDYLFVIPFTKEFSEMPYLSFLEKLLDSLRVKEIVVGFNYRFGHLGKGDAAVLKELALQYGYKATIVDPIMLDGKVISSTEIKNCIEEGKIDLANQMLGRAFSITGTVKKGKGLGKKIGFPTANVFPHKDQVLPKRGVYSAEVLYDDTIYKSLLNVGINPTFGQEQIHIEAYICDFEEDIYEKELTIYFNRFIRGERKFGSAKELAEQINRDLETAGMHKISLQI